MFEYKLPHFYRHVPRNNVVKVESLEELIGMLPSIYNFESESIPLQFHIILIILSYVECRDPNGRHDLWDKLIRRTPEESGGCYVIGWNVKE